MAVEIKQLAKSYGPSRGLLPLTMTIDRGECVAIVGHNGAGKSTLLKLLASWITPDAGSISVAGVPLQQRLTAVRTIGFVPEVPNLYELFSVDYNLQLFARLFALPQARVDTLIKEFELEAYRRTKVQALSKGLKQRVSLSRSLLPDPSLLLLDEPTSGLDFETSRELYKRLQALHLAGKTVVFSSHRPEEVRSFATRILVLHAGAVVFDGDPSTYFTSQAHQDLYQ